MSDSDRPFLTDLLKLFLDMSFSEKMVHIIGIIFKKKMNYKINNELL